MTDQIHDTIMKMVKNLKPRGYVELDHLSFRSTSKRSSSSLLNDSPCTSQESHTVKRMKHDKEFNLADVGSPEEMRRLRNDVLEGQNTVLNLENRIQHMHNVRNEMELMYQNENKLLKQQHENDRKVIEELEAQLQSTRHLKSLLAETDSNDGMLKIKKEEGIEESEESQSEMEEESSRDDREEVAETTASNKREGVLQMLLDTAVEDADAQKQRVLALEQRLSDSQRSLIERDLERRDQVLRDAGIRIEDLEYVYEHASEFQDPAKRAQAQAGINEWRRSAVNGICEFIESDSLLSHLLRSAVKKVQQQEISINTALHEKQMAETELERSQKLLTEMKKTSEQKETVLDRMTQNLAFVSQQSDSYRLQLNSYEKNRTPSSGHAVQFRINALKKIVDSYKELNATLNMNLENYHPSLYEYSESSANKRQQIVKLEDKVEQLKINTAVFRRRRHKLEVELHDFLHSNDNRQGRQVIHLADNPLANCLAHREQMVDNLKQEVELLKQHIRRLEDALETSKRSDSQNVEEIQALKEQIKTHQSQAQLLEHRFKCSLEEFKTVTYALFGYKIDQTSASMYKLTSINAQSDEDQLCFQINSEGNLSLLKNGFSSTLEHMVNLHLRHQKSIPLFLSELTMHLFSTTKATQTHEIE